MTKQVKIYAGSDTYEKWQQICNRFSSNTAAFAVVIENYFNQIQEDTMEQRYVYIHDMYGNNGEFITTFEKFAKMCEECFDDFDRDDLYADSSGIYAETRYGTEKVCIPVEEYDGDLSKLPTA